MMLIREVEAKSILTKSGITDYCINAYMGCGFGCAYCYAQLIIRKFHPGQQWGSYLDIKLNAPQLLEKEIENAKRGTVMLSSVTDPYQPMEKKYGLTRSCLEILLEHDFPITILTRSPLVLRDIELLKKFRDCTVGVSITTDNDKVKNLFEPFTPPFKIRVDTLQKLHQADLHTYAFIGPMLPMNSRVVGKAIAPHVDHVFIDKLNYPRLWKKIVEENKIKEVPQENVRNELIDVIKDHGVEIHRLF